MTRIALLCLFLFSQPLYAQETTKTWPPTTLINDVYYKDAQFDKKTVGNGFLVTHNNQLYAVTAKHVMILAKTPTMQVVDFEDQLDKWVMHPKNDSTQTVIMDELINSSRNDTLDFGFLGRSNNMYIDWLVFSVKENNSKVKPLEIRTTPLIEGESLYAIGWTYGDTDGDQRVYSYTYHNENGSNFNMRRAQAPDSPGGLSGSPVVDKDGKLVGVVSRTSNDPVTGETYNTPCQIKYLVEILKNA